MSRMDNSGISEGKTEEIFRGSKILSVEDLSYDKTQTTIRGFMGNPGSFLRQFPPNDEGTQNYLRLPDSEYADMPTLYPEVGVLDNSYEFGTEEITPPRGG